ncbi:MAG: glycosyltransferase family 4 protein [Anaerolineae bacterium]|jgi:glycosyltransferase involved in cell wall biosynthesis|nr:glycosyltransferase family 4 protein [Anaerolineae bacterium]
MRIAIDYTPALRQGAGIGRYTRGLVAGLAEIDRRNQYTLFSAGEAPSNNDWPPNFQLHASAIPARWLTAGWHRLHLPIPAELLTGDCDLYHSPDFTLPPLRRAHGLVTIHDLSFLRVPECADPGLRAFLEKAVPAAVARARRVLADSENTSKDLVEMLHVDPGKISVVTPAIEPRFRREENIARLAEVRARYRLPDRFILGLGTLEPRKNFTGLIAAFGKLARETNLSHALVIGGKPGWLYEEIYRLGNQDDLAGRVRFLGFVADEDLPALYSLADVFAFPSLYEGFGIPVLEAMACGTPVVTSNNSSLREAAGGAALMVEATDAAETAEAIAKVLNDTELACSMTLSGIEQASHFTWQRSARALLEAYERAAT